MVVAVTGRAGYTTDQDDERVITIDHGGDSDDDNMMVMMVVVVVKLMWQGMGGMMYIEEDDLCSHDFSVSLQKVPFSGISNIS